MKVAKDQDKLAAEEIRACAVERLSETRKRNLDIAHHEDQSQKIVTIIREGLLVEIP